MLTKKKANSGRKPIADKKVQVSVYIQQSKVKAMGGIDELKGKLVEYVDETIKTQILPKQ